MMRTSFKRYLACLTIVAVVIMSSSALADYTVGDWTVTRLTDNDYNDLYPEISGSNVTWIGNVDWEDWEVLLWQNGVTTQLTDDEYPDIAPQISGTNVVWQADSGPDLDIHLYDGSTVTPLTVNNENEYKPQISGSHVVWEGYGSGYKQIFLHDGSITTQLTFDSYSNVEPQVSGTSVVWTGMSPKEVFYYDGMTTHQLTSDAYNDRVPQVYGQYPDADFSIVWEGYNGTTTEIYRYDGLTTEQLTTSEYGMFRPQVHGSRIVYQGWYEGNTRAFLHDGATEMVVSPPGIDVFFPQVSESIVAWWAISPTDSQGEVFVYDGATVTQLTDSYWIDTHVRVSGTTVVWESYVDNHSSEIYMATKNPTSVDEAPGRIEARAFPNPFNPSTTIRFTLPEAADVRLDVYSMDGRHVRELVAEHRSRGKHEIQWDARDSQGRMMSSGTYVYRLQAGGSIETKKLTLLK